MIPIDISNAYILGLFGSIIAIEGIMIVSKSPKGNWVKYMLMVFCTAVVTGTLNLVPGYTGSVYETLFMYPIMILFYRLIFKSDFLECIIRVLLIITVLLILEALFTMLYSAIFSSSLTNVWSSESGIYSFYLLFITLLAPLALLAPLTKLVDRFWEQIKTGSIVLVNIYMYLVFAKMNMAIILDAINYNPTAQILIYVLAIAGNFFMVLYLVKNSKKQEQIKRFENLQSISGPLIDEIRSRQHDFKNHLQVLVTLLQDNTAYPREKLLEYIGDVTADLESASEIIKTKNPVLGALLYNKKNDALQKEIDFRAFGSNEAIPFPLEDYELISIIGNLLDNAIEAAGPGGQVVFSIGQKNGRSYLIVENTGSLPEDRTKLFFKGHSTKGGSRGYGLHNIKRIVERYKGTISATIEDGMVVFLIEMPYEREG